MRGQSFHHGHLRVELLERAEQVIREDGLEALSLRELARQAGVSHAAPRRHFPDRKALLDAVAERGFTRLTATLRAATESTGPDRAARFRAAASAYVEFAVHESRLHELMFTMLSGDAPEALSAAAAGFFAVSDPLLAPPGAPDATLAFDDPRRLLIIVSLQGTAALIAAGRIERPAAEALLDEVVRTFFDEAG